MPIKEYTPEQLRAASESGSGGDTETPAPTAAEPTMLQKVFQGAGDFAKGVGKGALSTLSSTDEWARDHLPAFMTNSNFGFGKPADLQHIHDLTTPANTAQSIGKGVEQVGEFLIPGGAEERGAAKLAELAPWAGKAAKPLAKVFTSGVSSGLVNKAQGGSFGAGAAGGVAGSGVGQLAHAFAPAIAESALNIRKLDRAYKEPGSIGRAILDETKGVRPNSVAESAREKLDTLNPQLENAADSASTGPLARILGTPNIVDLRPGRDVLQKALQKAGQQGERTTQAQLGPMVTHLSEDIGGAPIQPDVTARKILDLKRGFGNEFIHHWNPDTMEGVKGTAGRAYQGLSKAFEDAVPEARPLNKQIGALIPVAKRAESAELNAPTAQRIAHRIGAHTGALAGGIFGGMQGYQHGGVPGAIAGGMLGLVAPEVLASPAGEMTAARVLNSATPRILGRAGAGAALQLNRPAKKQAGSEK